MIRYFDNPDEISREKWSDFVLSHPKGTIFQSPQMYDVFKESVNYEPVFLACINGNNELQGLIVSGIFSEKSGIAGSLIKRSIVVGGPLLRSSDLLLEFISNYEELVNDKAVYSRLVNLYDMNNEFSGLKKLNFEFKDHLNYKIDLSQPSELLWKNLHNTRRRQIRRGIRRGIRTEVSFDVNNISDYYDILKQTYLNAGQPLLDLSYFESAYENLRPNKNLVFFSAYDDNKLIGHRMVLAYNNMLHDWYAGDLYDTRDLYTNDVLVWEVIKWGSENGYKDFDFGGAGEPDKEYGVREFKKKFGGTLVNYGNYLKVHQPIKYNLIQKAIPIYKKMRKS